MVDLSAGAGGRSSHQALVLRRADGTVFLPGASSLTLPPHTGPVTLTFDLHNRHTYSEEQVRQQPRLPPLYRDDWRVDARQHARFARDRAERVPHPGRPGGSDHRWKRRERAEGGGADRYRALYRLPFPEEAMQASILGEKLSVRPRGWRRHVQRVGPPDGRHQQRDGLNTSASAAGASGPPSGGPPPRGSPPGCSRQLGRIVPTRRLRWCQGAMAANRADLRAWPGSRMVRWSNRAASGGERLLRGIGLPFGQRATWRTRRADVTLWVRRPPVASTASSTGWKS